MADSLPCSRCPLLDLGVKYPVRDKRDPWRRMPRHFEVARKIFGRGMFSHQGALRLRVERLLGHYCRVQREKHGPCTGKRVAICGRITLAALSEAHQGSTEGERIAFAQAALRRAVNSEETHEALKATRISAPTATLRMPPITFKSVPSA